jgi:hypothetical protein
MTLSTETFLVYYDNNGFTVIAQPVVGFPFLVSFIFLARPVARPTTRVHIRRVGMVSTLHDLRKVHGARWWGESHEHEKRMSIYLPSHTHSSTILGNS